MKKRLYKWHRTLSLIIALPVLISASSGFMHPLMTNIRPHIATQGLQPVPVDSSKLRIPLQGALAQNHIAAFQNFRLIHIADNWFYQVQRTGDAVPVYLSTENGHVLSDGDWLYAQYLARQFLNGQEDPTGAGKKLPSVTTAGPMDCCDGATACVLNDTAAALVTSALRVTRFDNEYGYINRLLPVYRVSFERPDGIRIYVETTQDRFAFAIDDRRAAFNRIFTFLHTYSWLDFLGKGKLVVEFLLVFLAFITTLLGLCIFFGTRSKKAKGNGFVKSRRTHRYVAVTVSLFTLMFTFSGGYHALSKLKDDNTDSFFVRHQYTTGAMDFDFRALQSAVQDPITDVSLVRLDSGSSFWRVVSLPAGRTITGSKDLMKSEAAPLPEITYISTADHSVLRGGERRYAGYLACLFSGHDKKNILSATPVTAFTNEYNFADKRLPVWKVAFADHHHERYYVETATGRLSKRVNDLNILEDYSFALLHKHEFLGWAGKRVKDASTMFWAAAQVLMVLTGLILYFKWRGRLKQAR
ncbi:hypothetical protein [Compostibacter hankyongensis]|uniref:PepSY domain-containing protein n=1 Tax=Compostibacter hankyongensis TaxID=1007089 RepID=A0ABP8FC44_9BACT